MVKFEYPLQWPPQQPRTKSPEMSRFKNKSISWTGNYLVDELRLLGAKNVVISTNLKTKIGGGFYANNKVEDGGIAVYFELKGEGKTMACDKWNRPEHNIWALNLSVSAIRGLERWGGSEFLDGLFTGFKALPAPGDSVMMGIKYFSDISNKDHLQLKFKKLAKELHPDSEGGNTEQFQEMMTQYKQVKGNFP